MNHASLFSGIGGFDLAAAMMGWQNIFWCENDGFCQQILKYHFKNSIGYGNIKETDFTPHRGQTDILTGGFPCQPFSDAGLRGGTNDPRYLWPEMYRAIREIRPRWVVAENVRGLLSWNGGLVFDTVCADLENEGYEVWPFLLPACGVDAPHQRYRIWFIAYRADARAESMQQGGENGIYEVGTAPNADSHDAGRCRYGEVGRETGKNQSQQKERERFRKNIERISNKGIITNADKFNGYLSGFRTSQTSQFETPEIQYDTFSNSDNSGNASLRGGDYGYMEAESLERKFSQLESCRPCDTWFTPDTTSDRPQKRHKERTSAVSRKIVGFDRFPTQSPVCGGNDGLSFRLDGITFPRWRQQSIKGFGNAIVPQLAMQIFKTIVDFERTLKLFE
jgi:DNA (cytosine-5)-methyltransferase 1